ncbi:lactate dehydrogenase [Megasphaera vaginalis (ex Bordigoni et al. 2020)]|uniref:lactate dehydrogenase n=1 Tax=Megasphaera vaginalis (ex Bordigoni et al. 2020) TaxID=2045301 RepID=UPI000C7AD6D2|nr:lactate dehydrogenase [Megasphaera vaginalis (ex Bordigoni et al. 2020)]
MSKYIHDLPAAAGIEAQQWQPHIRQRHKKMRAHILALGDVGMTMLLGLRLLGGDVISSIGICDLDEKNLARLEMEINQVRYPFGEVSLPPVDIVTEKELFACDVFIFCASKGVPPVGAGGDVRMAQLEANRELIGHFAALAAAASYDGLVCVVSDPVDPLCAAFLDASQLSPTQIQGYGLGVMHARACYYAEREREFGAYLTDGRAFGPHGRDLVLVNSLEHYDDVLSRRLTELVVAANVAVRDLGYKPYIAPALSSAAISIVLTLRGAWHYGSVYLGNEREGAFFGLKNRLTSDGFRYEDIAAAEPLFARLQQAYAQLCEFR